MSSNSIPFSVLVMDRIPLMDKRQLESLRTNAIRVLQGRPEAKEILEACDRALERFKPKKLHQARARELMEEIVAERSWLQFESNRVKDGIKPSGNMMAGRVFASFYVSCKPPGKRRAASFDVVIREKGEQPQFWVYGFDRIDKKQLNDSPILQTDDLEKAATCFEDLVGDYITEPQQP